MHLTTTINGVEHSRAKILAIGKVLRQPMRDLLTREGRLVAISLAKSSQPYGTGQAAQAMGLEAVNRDIRKVYASAEQAYDDIKDEGAAKGFWKALRSGNIAKAQSILNKYGSSLSGVPIQAFDGGSAHKSARNKRGRVSLKRPGMIVLSSSTVIDRYIETIQKLVGYGKSAWVTIARKLVDKGAARGLKESGDISPAWISGKNAPGSVDWSGSPESPVITLTSHVSYASQILPQSARSHAVAIARGRLITNLSIAAKAEMKKLPTAA